MALWMQTTVSRAQEYMYEVGGTLGLSRYAGDAVRRLLIAPHGIAMGATARYNVNFRWALTSSLVLHTLRGATSYAGNVFPSGQTASFASSVLALSMGGEFHWKPLSDKFLYLGTSRLSPYLASGLSLIGAWGTDSGTFAPGVYAGFGIKYKLSSRLMATAEYRWTYSLTDRLDALSADSRWLDNPYGTSGYTLRGKDAFSGLLIGLSYHFGLRHRGACF